jgi:hypothetical protein
MYILQNKLVSGKKTLYQLGMKNHLPYSERQVVKC